MTGQCPRCGVPIHETAMGCSHCGLSFLVELPPASTEAVAYSTREPSYGAQFHDPNYAGAVAYTKPLRTGDCQEANAALMWAIAGIFCIGFIAGPMAIAKGLTAKRIIALNPGLSGGARATAAIVLGACDILFTLLWIVARLRPATGVGHHLQ